MSYTELCKIGCPCPGLVLIYIKTTKCFAGNINGPLRAWWLYLHHAVDPFVLRVFSITEKLVMSLTIAPFFSIHIPFSLYIQILFPSSWKPFNIWGFWLHEKFNCQSKKNEKKREKEKQQKTLSCLPFSLDLHEHLNLRKPGYLRAEVVLVVDNKWIFLLNTNTSYLRVFWVEANVLCSAVPPRGEMGDSLKLTYIIETLKPFVSCVLSSAF